VPPLSIKKFSNASATALFLAISLPNPDSKDLPIAVTFEMFADAALVIKTANKIAIRII
jgi:hypothetical protein